MVLQRIFSILAAIASCGLILSLGFLPSLYFDDFPAPYWRITAPLGAACSAILGVAFGRFLLRAFPLRFDGRRRQGIILLLTIAGVTVLLIWISLLFGKGPPSAAGKETLWFNSDLVFEDRLLGFLISVAWWFGAFGLPLTRHLTPDQTLDAPLILLLRRFSTFSDRTVLGALLKCSPRGTLAVFLVPQVSSAGDWNPFRIGFAGMNVLWPFAGAPIELRSNPDAWQAAIEVLARRAHRIVIDTSLPSAAIDSELDILRRTSALQKTLFLMDESRKEKCTSAAALLDSGVAHVKYVRSWRRAWPRLTLGVFVTPFAVLMLFLVLSTPFGWLLARNRQLFVDDCMAGMPQTVLLEMACRDSWSIKFVEQNWLAFAVIGGGLALWTYYVLFFRATLSKESIRQLRLKLRSPPTSD